MSIKVRLFVAAVMLAPIGMVRLAAADPAGVCPDDHVLFPATTQADFNKDANNNGLVCKKVNNQGEIVGGPDDTVDDIIV